MNDRITGCVYGALRLLQDHGEITDWRNHDLQQQMERIYRRVKTTDNAVLADEWSRGRREVQLELGAAA